MTSIFAFEQGHEARGAANGANAATPLLGRFRAVPSAQRQRASSRGNRNSLLGSWAGRGYANAVFGAGSVDSGDDEDEEGTGVRRWWATIRDLYIEPKQMAVGRIIDVWWSRWTVLFLLPAVLAVSWCALPFPQYPLPPDNDVPSSNAWLGSLGYKPPGHGEARVEVNFWFFLFIYYGCYNITALMWITKVFNIYSLNWWPESLGFPLTICIIMALSILLPIPLYCFPETRYLVMRNTPWIFWTFFMMAMPLLIAFSILLNHERHLSLRHSLSETQRIFTSSWWTGEADTISTRDRARRPRVNQGLFYPDASLEVALASDVSHRNYNRDLALRKGWIPASFMRFLWFCMALSIGIAAYILGETYAEMYLRTLPHNTIETIFYVYSWVITIHLLDALCGWILGGNEGERVGSYPLGWIFKLYFSLTYQTYVRALYARLRSPQQFIYLQILSSSFLIVLIPLTVSRVFHSFLTLVSINNQSYTSYQKFCSRNVLIRGFAENVSMITFLGSILVLHYGNNKDVYPYFAFDGKTTPGAGGGEDNSPIGIGNGEGYDFGLTFYASIVTWACEIAAGWIVRRIFWFVWKLDVTGEGKADFRMWPELLPTGLVVMVHVLQNMLFSIARLRFH